MLTETGAADGRQPARVTEKHVMMKTARSMLGKFYTINLFRRTAGMRNNEHHARIFFVAIYPPAIERRFARPAHAGHIDGDVTTAISASFVCGSFVEISLLISPGTGAIERATFRTNGCGFAVAASDVLCSWLSGKRLADLHGLDGREIT